MVLATKVGKERSFGIVLLLGIVTFGIYFIYWHYKAHDEVFKQFELDREGRDEGIVWMILGYVIFPPLQWMYQYMFVKNVQYVRQRLALKRGIQPGGFLGMTIPGNILTNVGLFLTFFGIVMLAAEPSDAPGGTTAQDAEDANAVGRVLLPIGLVVALAGLALSIVPYAMLQRDINSVWRAYDQRMRSLSGPAGVPPGGPGGPVQPAAAWGAGAPAAPPARPPSAPQRWQ